MKKTLALVFAVLMCVSVLVACGSSSKGIVGTWTATEDGQTVDMTFKADGKLSMTMMGVNVEGTYTAKDGKLSATVSLMGQTQEIFEDVEYKVDGDKLAITVDGDTQILNRKK